MCLRGRGVGVTLTSPRHSSVAAAAVKVLCAVTGLVRCPARPRRGQTGPTERKRGSGGEVGEHLREREKSRRETGGSEAETDKDPMRKGQKGVQR